MALTLLIGATLVQIKEIAAWVGALCKDRLKTGTIANGVLVPVTVILFFSLSFLGVYLGRGSGSARAGERFAEQAAALKKGFADGSLTTGAPQLDNELKTNLKRDMTLAAKTGPIAF